MDESPGKMYALATVLTTLAIVAVILRFYSRRIKKVRPSWDDYLIVLALVRLPLLILMSGLLDLQIYASDRSALSVQECACSSVSIQLGRYDKFADTEYAGAARGGLGRHTQITPDGIPIFDGRMEVLFKVGPEISKLMY